MKTFPLSADRASLGLTETGGHLSDVVFTLPDGRKVSPMHTSPWENEAHADDVPPILRVLRGDFFCAPFGGSDILNGPGHGLTANGTWALDGMTATTLDAVLDGDVMGATVSLHLEVRPGEAMVYQRHTLSGGSGRIPLGHHAMLSAASPLHLGFSPRVFAGTPPDVIETPPAGRSVLAYPQEIADLHSARLADGDTADLTVYPFAEVHEDLWMLSADRTQPFAWTAATCPEGGWVWFSLKAPRILPSTTVWLSNGGRTYAPWNARHRRVIGLEEVCSYFHLGHAASIADNPVSARGIPTAATLGGDLVINYAFGLAPAPAGFGAVQQILPTSGGVRLIDAAGRETFAACDLGFVAAPSN
jgi:hypothetical protein